MGVLQSTLDDLINDAPRLILRDLITKQLAAGSVAATPDLIEALTAHIIHGNNDPFSWDDGSFEDKTVHLSFSNSEIQEIDKKIDKLVDKLPLIVDDLSARIAKLVIRSLKKQWREVFAGQITEIAGFVDRLEGRWGRGFDLLRMLVAFVREMGDKEMKRRRRTRSKKRRVLYDVLLRLHIRSCQVADEIVTLLENGFADGAMARWRTLHEICVVAMVVADGGPTVAERYQGYRIVEIKRDAEEYTRSLAATGYSPIRKSNLENIEEEYTTAIKTYGKSFKNEYGWASIYLGKERPRFSDLEAAAGHARKRLYYKLASHNVHAGPHRLFSSLAVVDNELLITGGRSNAGLAVPGENTAITLTQTTLLLTGEKPDFDALVSMRILIALSNEAGRALARADTRFGRDEAARQRPNRRSKPQP